MKAALNRLGYYTPLETVGMTGVPDADLFAALRAFQSNKSLAPSGEMRPDDETLKAINQELKNAPDAEYIWKTVGDDKVRDSHAALNGKIRKWSEKPSPTEEINCRCWAGSAPRENDSSNNICIRLLNRLEKGRKRLSVLNQEETSLMKKISLLNLSIQQLKNEIVKILQNYIPDLDESFLDLAARDTREFLRYVSRIIVRYLMLFDVSTILTLMVGIRGIQKDIEQLNMELSTIRERMKAQIKINRNLEMEFNLRCPDSFG